jgi:hypothetical protein
VSVCERERDPGYQGLFQYQHGTISGFPEVPRLCTAAVSSGILTSCRHCSRPDQVRLVCDEDDSLNEVIKNFLGCNYWRPDIQHNDTQQNDNGDTKTMCDDSDDSYNKRLVDTMRSGL